MAAMPSRRQGVLSGLGQTLVQLTAADTRALLSDASAVLRGPESQASAAAIVRRLGELNPDIGSQFHPKEEAVSRLPLRMLLPAAATAEKPAVTSFVVVSYCWHYPGWPLAAAAQPIAPGWDISRPMVDAVMGLVKGPGEGVWLDKLCINQASNRDRTAHVAAMDIVYRSARRVAILLEDVQLAADEEAAGLVYAGFYADLSRELAENGLEGAAKSDFFFGYFPRREQQEAAASAASGGSNPLKAGRAFAMKMLGARWYSRAWCAHESRVASHRKIDNPLFLCYGHDGRVLQFEFRFVHYVSMYLSDSDPSPSDSVSNVHAMSQALGDPNPVTLRQRYWRILKLMPDATRGISAMQHLISILSHGCAQQGDLMSIALNTAGVPLYYRGDAVKTVEDVIWIFSLLVLAAGDVMPLVVDGPESKIVCGTGTGEETLSWMTRPRQGAREEQLLTPWPHSITAATAQYIELDLLLFASQPQKPSPDSLDVATSFIEEHGLKVLAREFLAVADKDVSHQVQLGVDVLKTHNRDGPSGPLGVFLQPWLGRAIDSGLGWVLQFPDAMRADTVGWQHGTMGEAADPRLAHAASSLLSILRKPSSSEQGETEQDETEEKADDEKHGGVEVEIQELTEKRDLQESAEESERSVQPGGQGAQQKSEEHERDDTTKSEHTLHTVIRFLTCLLDPRLPLFHFNPRGIKLGQGPSGQSHHITTPSVSNRSWVAVPVAVAHLPGWQKKAWVVEPFDPEAALEDAADHLARAPTLAELEAAGKVVSDLQMKDVYPVLDSGPGNDCREPRNDARATWRLRRRQVLFGWERPLVDAAVDADRAGVDGAPYVVRLNKQRMYGADDYDWKAIHASVLRVNEGLGLTAKAE